MALGAVIGIPAGIAVGRSRRDRGDGAYHPVAEAGRADAEGRRKCHSFSRYGSRQAEVPPSATPYATLTATAVDLRITDSGSGLGRRLVR
jgi:hypothetical protein